MDHHRLVAALPPMTFTSKDSRSCLLQGSRTNRNCSREITFLAERIGRLAEAEMTESGMAFESVIDLCVEDADIKGIFHIQFVRREVARRLREGWEHGEKFWQWHESASRTSDA